MSKQTESRHFYEVSDEDKTFLENMRVTKAERLAPPEEIVNDSQTISEGRIQELLQTMASLIASCDFDTFCDYVLCNREDLIKATWASENIVPMILAGYKMGITHESGLCANNLGALYYMGDLVEQDYEKAAELYELAIQWGCDQSIINMGYIYEYGRIGEPDYAKAFEYYALAAALTQMSEALYKLGDMYSRGQSVKKDIAKAVQLWRQSYKNAHTPVEVAQPAIRLAPLYLDGSPEAKIDADPMYALTLYQKAEIGLRIDIKQGATYYRKRLCQAIEGQEKARLRLDNVTIA